MKTILRSILLFSAATMLLTGCETDIVQHGKAPETISDVNFNRTRIGGGQPVEATCELPSGGQHIATVEYSWVSNNGISYSGQQTSTKSTFSFIAPTTAGQYKLTFKAQYIFTSLDLDGNNYKDLSSVKTYTVEACDVLNSFWQDDIAETILNRPSLTKRDENTYVGLFPDQFSMSSLDPSLIPTMYTFTAGKLSRITESEVVETVPSAKVLFQKYLAVRLKIERLLNVSPVSEIITWTESGKTENFNPQADDASKIRIGQGIIDKKAEIISVFKGEKTDIELSLYHYEKINYMRTYQKAGTMK